MNEFWKIILALVLIVLFVLSGHSAYYSMKESLDEYAPPTDYKNGDSYDRERAAGELAESVLVAEQGSGE